MNAFTEDALVQQTAADYLERVLGWTSVHAQHHEVFGAERPAGGKGVWLGRDSERDVLLRHVLRERLEALNPGYPAPVYDTAVRTLAEHNAALSTLQVNREKHALLRDGVPVDYRDGGQKRTATLRVFDFDAPERNHFLAVRELWVQGALYRKRPDLVGFVNGVPLVAMEFKNVTKPLRDAYDKNLSDYRDAIPGLFYYNAVFVLANGTDARYGTYASPYDYFHEWKRLREEGESVLSMERLLAGLCGKAALLEVFEHFILFDDKPDGTVKVVARNHQVLGVRRAYEALVQREERGGKLGVFWHTQGSGKSYSMVFLTRRVHRSLSGSFTFVILTDRDDLDAQIYRTYVGCGLVGEKEPARAASGAHLRELLGQQKRYVFTLIQKFGQQPEAPYTERSDIVVIADEAHRSQYGDLSLNMRKALPNAAFIAFTGTPLFDGDEPTRALFGDYVSTYDFQRAVEDGATVPLFYDARGERISAITEDLGEQVAAKIAEFELEDADQIERLEREMSREYHVLTASKRLKAIAEDFVRHYSTVAFDTEEAVRQKGKAMFIALDKLTCVKMHGYITEAWTRETQRVRTELAALTDPSAPLAYGAIEERRGQVDALRRKLAWMDETRAAVIVSEEQGEVARFEKHGLDIRPHRALIKDGFRPDARSDARGPSKDVETAFKDEAHPFRIAIVCAMWLTGFDVPSLETLYLDKPLKAHTLMQAIARANRVREGKHNGLIVDYYGILKYLRKALATYAQARDGSRGGEGTGTLDPARPPEQLLADLAEALDEVETFLEEAGVDVKALASSSGFAQIGAIADAKDVLDAGDETRRRFGVLAREVFKRFRACIAFDAVHDYRARKNLVALLYESLQAGVERADISDLTRALNQIVDDAVTVDAPGAAQEDARPYDISRIDFERLRKEFARAPHKNTTVQTLRQVVEARLAQMLAANPLRRDLQERYEAIVEEYNREKDRVVIEQTFDELVRFTSDLDEEAKRHVREGLTEESLALFDLLVKPDLKKGERGRLKKVARELLGEIRRVLEEAEDWGAKVATREEVRTLIKNFLYAEATGLPYPAYSSEDVDRRASDVYQHVYTTMWMQA